MVEITREQLNAKTSLMHSQRRRQQRINRRSRNGSTNSWNKECLAIVGLSCIVLAYLIATIVITKMTTSSSSASSTSNLAEKHQQVLDEKFGDAGHRPRLKLQDVAQHENQEFFDFIAKDIQTTLNCEELLAKRTREVPIGVDDRFDGMDQQQQEEEQDMNNKDENDNNNNMEAEVLNRRRRRRRLDENGNNGNGGGGFDDDRGAGWQDGGDNMINQFDVDATAQHLFCVAAYPLTSADRPELQFWLGETDYNTPRIHCDVHEKQAALLHMWSNARAEINEDSVFLRTLGLVKEHEKTLLEKTVWIWAPEDDDGTEFMLKKLNDVNNTVDYGGIVGIHHNLGPGKLFVDVGSGLGYTAMAVAILYPRTDIVSIEAAPTNWLLQQLNWLCNDFEDDSDVQQHYVQRQVILAGVGPSTGNSQIAKFKWRPHETTSVKAWEDLPLFAGDHIDENNEAERVRKNENAMTVTVRLKPWHKIQAEAEITKRVIDVLNVDCEGCEYNLLPALTETELENMSTIMGEMHWGYMPQDHLPSSVRGNTTHQRLCRHENFARTSIECCAFPDLPVISSVKGEVLIQDADGIPKAGTVADIAGDLCKDFKQWAKDHSLYSIESDWGWFQVTR